MDYEPVFSIKKIKTKFEAKNAVDKDLHEMTESMILALYNPEQQKIIQDRKKVLATLGFFIGKDFDMPIFLNAPGKGWHWNFDQNYIKIDPEDLLNKPMDYLRFVICHEGGHRRISRTDFIPEDVLKQPGFLSMMNCIEDPRMNNFVAEAYPTFKEQMIFSYHLDEGEFIQTIKEKGVKILGHKPKAGLAGGEYIRQWFREVQDQPFEVYPDLPDDVRDVVQKTLPAAQDSWWRYPSKEEADMSEETIRAYAERSYKINLEKIWPLFNTLVQKDIETQKTQQLLKDLNKKSEEERNKVLDELKDKIGDEGVEKIKEKLAEARALQEGEADPEQKPIQLDELPPELLKLLAEYIQSLPKELLGSLTAEAAQAIKDFEEEVMGALQGKMVEVPVDAKEDPEDKQQEKESPPEPPSKEVDDMRKKIEEMLNTHDSEYEEVMQEVLPIIEELENDLREIFVARRAKKWETGFKTGKKIDIKKRIQEQAKGVNVFESRSWQKREHPEEKDYAITILVDLSGSMQNKIAETFKAVVVLSEVLNKLSINIEILGFNNRLHPYQEFEKNLTDDMRKRMGGMLREVYSTRASYNDDGWALGEASKRLAKQKASEKFLIALSDGLPAESSIHSGREYDLPYVIKTIQEQSDQKLIGLGVGSGTEHVETYYPNSVANITVEQMAQKLADIIREAIANYENF
ncbi:VWA domain-containing protein [Candidatus Woesebacteria bacterium]|nr:VWA domain-containing protein [Candidatus Woesebacteria bacterium]